MENIIKNIKSETFKVITRFVLSQKRCVYCGEPVNSHRFMPIIKEQLELKSCCHTCDFWIDVIENIIYQNSQEFNGWFAKYGEFSRHTFKPTIDLLKYTICITDNYCVLYAKDGGIGENKVVKMKDGRILKNVWFGQKGTMPMYFRKYVTPNVDTIISMRDFNKELKTIDKI